LGFKGLTYVVFSEIVTLTSFRVATMTSKRHSRSSAMAYEINRSYTISYQFYGTYILYGFQDAAKCSSNTFHIPPVFNASR